MFFFVVLDYWSRQDVSRCLLELREIIVAFFLLQFSDFFYFFIGFFFLLDRTELNLKGDDMQQRSAGWDAAWKMPLNRGLLGAQFLDILSTKFYFIY